MLQNNFQAQFNLFNLSFKALSLTIITLTLTGAIYAQIFNPQSKLDPTFQNPKIVGLNSSVNRVLALPDGKFLAAGKFEVANGELRGGIVRFNIDGTLDTSFRATVFESVSNQNGTTATVGNIALQSDGRILYLTDNGNCLQRLTVNGASDTTFTAVCSIPGTSKIIVLPNNNIFVATSTNVVSLSPNGASQLSLVSIPTGGIKSLALQGDKILIGGDFVLSGNSTRRHLARFNADGSFDGSFNYENGANASVDVIELFPDGKILVGGTFSVYQNQIRSAIAKLDSNGILNTTFIPPSGTTSVNSFIIEPDIIWVGGFENPTGLLPNRRIARLLSTGVLFDFNLVYSGSISSIAKAFDGKLLVGGNFTKIQTGSNFTVHQCITRLASNPFSFVPDATLTTRPALGSLPTVRDVAVRPNGKILVGGSFNIADNRSFNNLVQLNDNGTPDASFAIENSGVNDAVNAIAVQNDGKVIAAGRFSSYFQLPTGISLPARGILRYLPDGSLDPNFVLTTSFTARNILDIELQSDGKILIAGEMTIGGEPKALARLNQDGSFDYTFNTPNFGASNIPAVLKIEVLPTGKILFGGLNLYQFGKSLYRINPDGTEDTSFLANVQARTFAVESGGGIIYTTPLNQTLRRLNFDGSADFSFPTYTTPAGNFINTIELTPDDRILFGGLGRSQITVSTNAPFFEIHNRRTNARFSTFNPSFENLPAPEIRFIKRQTDGRYFVGGRVIGENGIPRIGLMRLQSGILQKRKTVGDFDGDGKAEIALFRPTNGNWYRLQSSNGASIVQPWGISGDQIVPNDYDDDGKTDHAVFRNGTWFILRSNGNTFFATPWGISSDIPVPGKYDNFTPASGAPGTEFVGVFRTGTWWVAKLPSSQQVSIPPFQFGQTGDKPLVGDFDGDGVSDYAVYRNGTWYINGSYAGVSIIQFGLSNDKTVVADYDNDAKDDIAVYRDGVWYINRSNEGLQILQFGLASDIPVPADYDGDKRADIAVFRPSNGTWYILQSRDGLKIIQYGTNGDQPIPAAYVR